MFLINLATFHQYMSLRIISNYLLALINRILNIFLQTGDIAVVIQIKGATEGTRLRFTGINISISHACNATTSALTQQLP